MIKFLKVLSITIFSLVLLVGTTFGIAYAVDRDVAISWLEKIGIVTEAETPETPEDPETPVDPEEPTAPEDPEEPEEPEDPEEIVYVTNVADYEFSGNTITAYNGDDENILLPTSYSTAGTEIVEQTFVVEFEIFDYLMENLETIEYPLTIKDASNQEYLIFSEMDIMGNSEIVYPVTLEIEQNIYIEGNDYQITSIAEKAFVNSCNLTKVIIPENIISVGEHAFNGCYSLVSVIFPQSLISIGEHAFNSCYSLASITIPKNVTSIDNTAFYYCSSLVEIYNYSNLQISNETTEGNIGYYAKVIYNSSDLIEEKLESRIQVINNIQYYVYESDFIALAPSISRNELTTVTLDNRTTVINEKAFYICNSLTSITIPENVNLIGDYAFHSSNNLTTIIFLPITPPTIAYVTWSPLIVETIIVPNESIEEYKSAQYFSEYADIIVGYNA